MRFKTLSILTGGICLILAAVWFSLPEWILTHWRIGYDYGDGLVSRRMACLFAGFGALLLGLRNANSPEVRRAAGNGVIVTCALLIGLGIYEVLSHHAGDGILFAVALETLICLAFLTVSDSRSVEQPAPVR